MGGYVQPPALKVKADSRGGGLAEDLLAIPWVRARQNPRRARDTPLLEPLPGAATLARVSGSASAIFAAKRHELASQRLEDNRQLPCCCAGFVLIEERIVDGHGCDSS